MLSVEMNDGSIYQLLRVNSEKYAKQSLKECSGGVKRVIPADEVENAIQNIQPHYSPDTGEQTHRVIARHIVKFT